MKLSNDQMTDIINSVVPVWAAQELKYYFERAKKVGKATGEGQSNISVQTIRATAGQVAHVMFAFRDYMRYQDMKTLDMSKTPPYQDIRDWIEAKGTGKFKSGFVKRNGKLPTDDKQLMNAIAWGIVKSKNRRHKQKKWYNKAKWAGINVLERRLMDEMQRKYIEEIKNLKLK